MKYTKLKSNRSVEASEHYGILFSSINLPIFHVCEDLFIDHDMIKWLSTVPQREPSSFSLLLPLSVSFSLPTSPSLCLFLHDFKHSFVFSIFSLSPCIRKHKLLFFFHAQAYLLAVCESLSQRVGISP